MVCSVMLSYSMFIINHLLTYLLTYLLLPIIDYLALSLVSMLSIENSVSITQHTSKIRYPDFPIFRIMLFMAAVYHSND